MVYEYLDGDHPLRVEGGDVGDGAHGDLRARVLATTNFRWQKYIYKHTTV